MKSHIPSLNGIRAISITMVILYHFNIHNYLPKHGIIKLMASAFFDGPLGVTIFFFVSGFLITTLLIKEKEHNGNISLKNFYCRRIIRIFPAYYFLLFVYYILTYYKYFYIGSTDWISDLTYTKQFFKRDGIFETNHLWSLSVEEVFYLIWPFFFIYFDKYRFLTIFSVVIACSLIRLFTYEYPAPKCNEVIYTSADSLLLGCLFAIRYEEIVLWISNRKGFFILAIILFAFSILSYSYLYHLESISETDKISAINVKLLLSFAYAFFGQTGSITNLLIGFIIICSINIKNLWFKFLNLPVLNYLGKLSYSLYLWQQLFTADRPYLHSLPIPVLILFILLAASLSYYVIEKPFLKLKHKLETVKPVL